MPNKILKRLFSSQDSLDSFPVGCREHHETNVKFIFENKVQKLQLFQNYTAKMMLANCLGISFHKKILPNAQYFVRRASRRYQLKYVYSALGLLAVSSIYISTLGFQLAMLVRKMLKAWHMYGTCVARAVPCNFFHNISFITVHHMSVY